MSGDSPDQAWTTCTCNNCLQHLEFDAANAGETIQCPHCQMDTVLFIPCVPTVSLPRRTAHIPKPEPKKAERVEQKTYKEVGVERRLELTRVGESHPPTKVENQLRTVADISRATGIIGGVLILSVALGVTANTQKVNLWLCGAGIASIVNGVVLWAIFGAGAEIIRLLDDFNRSKFKGKLTELSVHLSYKCSLCNTAAQPTQTHCSLCGAEFNPR